MAKKMAPRHAAVSSDNVGRGGNQRTSTSATPNNVLRTRGPLDVDAR